jgi:hypothetical protein
MDAYLSRDTFQFIEVPTDVSAEAVSAMRDALVKAVRAAGVG